MTRRVGRWVKSFAVALPDGREVDVTVTFDGYYDPGCTYGLPENCYPPDGEVTVHTVATEADGTLDFDEWAAKVGLTEKDIGDIEDRLMDEIRDAQFSQEED